jgi:hypothetical protein
MAETTATPLGSGIVPAVQTVYTPEELAAHEAELIAAIHGHMQATVDEQKFRSLHEKARDEVARFVKLIDKKKADLAKVHK